MLAPQAPRDRPLARTWWLVCVFCAEGCRGCVRPGEDSRKYSPFQHLPAVARRHQPSPTSPLCTPHPLRHLRPSLAPLRPRRLRARPRTSAHRQSSLPIFVAKFRGMMVGLRGSIVGTFARTCSPSAPPLAAPARSISLNLGPGRCSNKVPQNVLRKSHNLSSLSYNGGREQAWSLTTAATTQRSSPFAWVIPSDPERLPAGFSNAGHLLM